MACTQRRPSSPARRGALALAAVLLALAAVAAPAAARQLTLSVTPELPTWNDVVQLRVSGEVVTSCDASIVHLGNLRKSATLGSQLSVEVDLTEDPCEELAPPAVVPFAVEIELGRLLPGPTVVTVSDLAAGGAAQRDLLVHEVSRLGLDLPRTALGNAPVKVGVTHHDPCAQLQPQVEGNVITLFYGGGCPIIPPPLQLMRSEVDLGLLPAGDYEVRLTEPFGSPPSLQRLPMRVWDAAGCLPGEDGLCLQRGRFRVGATWRAFDAGTGAAHAAPLPGNESSGLLWFFAADNAELTVKVLDGCGVNGAWWVFLSSASTVEYEVTVTDTATGSARRYRNELGHAPRLIADTGAFPCP